MKITDNSVILVSNGVHISPKQEITAEIEGSSKEHRRVCGLWETIMTGAFYLRDQQSDPDIMTCLPQSPISLHHDVERREEGCTHNTEVEWASQQEEVEIIGQFQQDGFKKYEQFKTFLTIFFNIPERLDQQTDRRTDSKTSLSARHIFFSRWWIIITMVLSIGLLKHNRFFNSILIKHSIYDAQAFREQYFYFCFTALYETCMFYN